jgi:hypothetical protein
MLCFSQSPDYANGNGTIIETRTEGSVEWVLRKHIQRLQIGDLANETHFSIYDKLALENRKVIYPLKLKDYINITQVAETRYADEYYVFLKVRTDNDVNGWLLFGKQTYDYAKFRAPYFKNRWEITERITIREKTWTVRKMTGDTVSVWEVLNIRDKPGLVDTKVISQIIPPRKYPQVNLDVSEMTEESETIDGRTDGWLKIAYQGIEGWIFGGYATVERGGPKYHIPESIIESGVSWY